MPQIRLTVMVSQGWGRLKLPLFDIVRLLKCNIARIAGKRTNHIISRWRWRWRCLGARRVKRSLAPRITGLRNWEEWIGFLLSLCLCVWVWYWWRSRSLLVWMWMLSWSYIWHFLQFCICCCSLSYEHTRISAYRSLNDFASLLVNITTAMFYGKFQGYELSIVSEYTWNFWGQQKRRERTCIYRFWKAAAHNIRGNDMGGIF